MASSRCVVTFRCDEQLARAIRQAARRDGRYPSAFLRLLVSRALESHVETPEQTA